MNGNHAAGALCALAFLLAACGERDRKPDTASLAEQYDARFHYDLGVSEIDVSGYPPEQQENYEVFLAVCSQCHTPARALNSPIASKEDWRRYIERMQHRGRSGWNVSIGKEDAEKIVDFLAYDAQLWKIGKKKSFERNDRQLRQMFEQIQAERRRIRLERDKLKARPAPTYTGEKPQP